MVRPAEKSLDSEAGLEVDKNRHDERRRTRCMIIVIAKRFFGVLTQKPRTGEAGSTNSVCAYGSPYRHQHQLEKCESREYFH